MKLLIMLTGALCISSVLCYGQPQWSGEIRSDREMRWMKDSLHLSSSQVTKIAPVSLNFQKGIDQSGEISDKWIRTKKQHELMRNKDASMKKLLSKKQFDTYYRHEMLVRQREHIQYPPGRQPN